MFTRNSTCWALSLLIFAPALWAQNDSGSINLGTAITESDLAEFDLVAPPDGSGNPEGTGTASEGREVFAMRCAACHGMNGEGTSGNTVLVGGNMSSEDTPLRTVGSYWPHASTVFDYIRRAMPADAPKSLSNEEVYKVTAYLLYLNGILEEGEEVNAASLQQIVMPNADGFIDQSSIQ